MPNGLSSFLALLVIGGLCGLALTQTHRLTAKPIEDNRIRQAQALLSELLERPAPTDLIWVSGVSGGCGDWHFVRGAINGYAGPISYLALLKQNTLRLRITQHQETPGIADFLNHAQDPYLPDLDDTPTADWAKLDNISGATITHKALRRMAGQAQGLVNQHRQRNSCEATSAE